MKKIDSILESRLSSNNASHQKPIKVRSLAERSNKGQLSGYASLVSTVQLSEEEKKSVQKLLHDHVEKEKELFSEELFQKDVENLTLITQEIKSITQQSILLHGERIKKAQQLLASYTDGAFSAWLFAVYGNRQTPYNFLVYYQFYHAIEEPMQLIVEKMPKQAIYVLAGRNAPLSEKIKLIEQHHGDTKEGLLEEIRKWFPLSTTDKRKSSSLGKRIAGEIKKNLLFIEKHAEEFSEDQKAMLKKALEKAMKALFPE